ncbi:MAG: DMT family transporter [Chlamydiota bacterium]
MDQKLNKFGLPSLVIISLLAASAEPLLVKIGFQRGYSLLSMLFFRNIIACLTALLFVRKGGLPQLSSLIKIFPLALLLFTVNACILFSLQFMTISSILIIIATTPLFVALTNQFLGRDLLQKFFWIGLGVSFIGICLSVGIMEGLPAFPKQGFLALLLAILCSTTYRVYMESVAKKIPPVQISFCIFSINGLLTVACVPFFKESLNWEALSIATWTGIAAVLANIAFISSVKLIGATRMSIMDMLQRPLIMIAAIFILEEYLTMMQITGCVLTLAGTQLTRIKERSITEG